MSKFNDLVDSIYNEENHLEVAWEQRSGRAVEDFITGKLENLDDSQIVGATYAGTTLTLQKADNSVITCEVAVVDPTYTYGIKIYGLDYNGTIIETGSNTI
jgi:hypothetical protein